MTLARDDLVLSTGTVGNPPLRVLLEAAAAGGFTALAVWPHDLARWLADGDTLASVRAACRGAGLAVTQVDALVSWTAGPASRVAKTEEESLFDAAGALAAPCVSAIAPLTDRVAAEHLHERFRGLCDRAAARGLRIALEPSPWKRVMDLASATRLVTAAGRPDTGLVVDSWHMFRGGVPLAELAGLPGARVTAVQVSDAPSAAEDDLVAETMGQRRLPGDGDIDLVGFLRALDGAGSNAPLTVEVLSADLLAAAGPVEVARLAGKATRELLARALPG